MIGSAMWAGSALAAASAVFGAQPESGSLLVRCASADISPDRPGALAGQFRTGAEVSGNLVGPENGQVRVGRTLEATDSLWKEEKT